VPGRRLKGSRANADIQSMNALQSERGSVVLGALTKLLVVALVAVVAYDAAAIGYAHYQAVDHGATAADQAGESWRASQDVKQAYHAAAKALAGTNETIDAKSFTIGADGTVTFEVTVPAKTLVAQRLSFTRNLTVAVAHISASTAAPGA
jgi:hypothetical protein